MSLHTLIDQLRAEHQANPQPLSRTSDACEVTIPWETWRSLSPRVQRAIEMVSGIRHTSAGVVAEMATYRVPEIEGMIRREAG